MHFLGSAVDPPRELLAGAGAGHAGVGADAGADASAEDGGIGGDRADHDLSDRASAWPLRRAVVQLLTLRAAYCSNRCRRPTVYCGQNRCKYPVVGDQTLSFGEPNQKLLYPAAAAAAAAAAVALRRLLPQERHIFLAPGMMSTANFFFDLHLAAAAAVAALTHKNEYHCHQTHHKCL